jgi:CDP-diacylglycerol--glycerol-3-phosphate 3-phosphatidyltransferase/cardiolipin synthase
MWVITEDFGKNFYVCEQALSFHQAIKDQLKTINSLQAAAHGVSNPFAVTVANQITLIRILLIPLFVGFALYYAHSVQDGAPDERLYLAAVITFAVASLSDALDGYIARRFNQQSKLGVILDPLADKLLMLAAVCTLSFSAWPAKLPLYFVILSLSREILTIAGAFVIKFCAGKVTIIPHWTGKVSTFTQIAAISSAMLRIDWLLPWTTALASIFVVTSGGIYIYEAYRQISAASPGNPHEH